MRKVIKGTILALVLVAAEGFSETFPLAESAAGHLLTCPHCGFAIANPAAVASPAAVTTRPVAAVSPAAVTTKKPVVHDWKSSVYGGFSAQSGNANTKAYNYGGEYSRYGKIYRGKLKLDGKYGEAEDQVTVSKVESAGEMRRMFHERWFTYGVLSVLHDGLKDISYRVKAGPGLGYYFVDTKELKVDVSSGPLYVHEKTSDSDAGYLAWRFAHGVDWQITDAFRWWGLVEMDVEPADTSAYTVEVKTGVENKINNRMSLLVTLEDDYDSHPEAKGNIEKNDFQVSTGIRYNF
jgi:putative salt-induced outer membrane protein YdiY